MKHRKLISILMVIVLCLSSVSVFAQDAANNEQVVTQYSNTMIKQIVRSYCHNIADNFYYGIDDDELLFSVICQGIDDGKIDVNNAVKAMIKTLDDKYSEFYTPEEYQKMQENVTGEISGIGVMILENNKGVVITSVIENSPAQLSGLLAGDYITTVDGKSTQGLTAAKVKELVAGKIGTEVKIGVLRGESNLEFTIKRAVVELSQTESRMLTDDIAYLKITQFTKGAADEVKEYVKDLQKKSIKKLVIDLRDNPGGELEAAKSIAETFISAGKIGELRYKDETKNEVIYSRNYNSPRFKIALLVNEHSASASEFLTAALQGRKAATVIGKKTFGKGSMQILLKIVTGAGMKYTIGEFVSYDGKRIHDTGITPDIIVENGKQEINEASFAQIDLDKVSEGGKNGEMNLALEERLSVLGFLEEEADEVYDEKTKQAVRELQNILGYESTGVPGFYEFLYLKDYNYKDMVSYEDNQLKEATNYLKKR